jgi:hypothetical protein
MSFGRLNATDSTGTLLRFMDGIVNVFGHPGGTIGVLLLGPEAADAEPSVTAAATIPAVSDRKRKGRLITPPTD